MSCLYNFKIFGYIIIIGKLFCSDVDNDFSGVHSVRRYTVDNVPQAGVCTSG